ncbi:MAG: HDIG domain-containing protein [Verrucomicrobiaceae bacterium]|nr:HDIG domain-containing protein [Verrucomicrobiaceae bacterium]
MFESLRRAQLFREGYSCGRTRRKNQDDDFWDVLRCHPSVTGVVAMGFVIGVLILMQASAGWTPGMASPGLTKWFYAVVLSAGMLVHLHLTNKEVTKDNRLALLILGTLFGHLALAVMVQRFGSAREWPGGFLASVMPHAVAPLVLSVILGRRMGMFAALHCSVLGSLLVPGVTSMTWISTGLIVGAAGVLSTRRVRRRNRFLIAGLCVGGTAGLVSFILASLDGSIASAELGQITGTPFASGLLTGLLAGGFLPVMESAFGVTTDITWLEQADLNHPLMRRLSMEAPGTYHHSLVVANLAEAAAEAISANAAMCRVCAYFHDIGKLNKPEYFIENMDPAHNPHADLTARMSTLILVAHVKDGVDLAIKHNLNSRIIDVIEQHHGTSLAWYFYQQALNQKAEMLRLVKEEKASEDDIPQISEDVFRYPGPKPRFKESAIISLADAVESASRTLDKPTAQRIEQMVDEIVQTRMFDGQLDECDLTLSELARVKASFVKTLASMMHSRIKYQQRAVETPPQRLDTSTEPGSSADGEEMPNRKSTRRRTATKSTPAA